MARKQVVVRRVAWSLSTLGVLAALGFVRLVEPPTARHATRPAADAVADASSAGADLFARHCAGCHAAADLRASLPPASDPAREIGRLRDFLDRHGDTDAAGDAQIAAFLLGDTGR